jgi:hypothetical protein
MAAHRFVKGAKRPPGAGRKKGKPNKHTTNMRIAYTHFVEGNIPKFQTWLNRVAKHSPAEALNIVARFSEFCLPKLMRAEVTGEDGSPLVPPSFGVTFVNGGPGFGGVPLLQDDDTDREPVLIEHKPVLNEG